LNSSILSQDQLARLRQDLRGYYGEIALQGHRLPQRGITETFETLGGVDSGGQIERLQ
jgi:hypothetical protein